ncbi:hypothetical protein VTK73DRAFT_5258 [Phialemonium thermophilum]|uniref:Uncharacterized protein n=1 Tax=Phialemonium thermophilum TaxID=223376 RepID=A0ABR3V2H8_9PEZI
MSMPYGTAPDASLTLKWLDLLIGDATTQYGPLPESPFQWDGTNILGGSAVQSQTTLAESTVSHHLAADDAAARDVAQPLAMEARVETQNAYLRERVPVGKDSSRDKDKVWQTLEPINLQAQELILFRHFTENISPWVSSPDDSMRLKKNCSD